MSWKLAPAALLGLACAGAPPAPGPGAPPPAPPDATLEAEAIAATTPAGARHVIFAWQLQESGARFGGQGVARVQGPDRARIDLFGPRGETYLAAAAVGREVRLPPGLPQPMIDLVPPPSLLWAAMGVFLPPDGAQLVGARRDGADVALEYRAPGGAWSFALRDGRLRAATFDRSGAGRQSVEIQGEPAAGPPERATFRDWAAFRELTFTLDEVRDVDAFPPDIWSPGR